MQRLLGKSAIWLRDHCRCHECFDNKSMQRLVNPFKKTLKYTVEENCIKWGDGHVTLFSQLPKSKHLYKPKVPWSQKVPENPIPFDLLPNKLPNLLEQIYLHGIAFVSNIPPTKQHTIELSEMLGPILNTHYGTFWEFEADGKHKDRAYSNNHLPPHTDGSYYSVPPGLQLFNLAYCNGIGGEQIYVDGLNLFNQLSNESIKILSKKNCIAHSIDHSVILQNDVPFSVLTHQNDQFLQIRYNNQDRSVLELPADEQLLFYNALQELEILVEKGTVQMQLERGKAVILDNWRVLHGRNSFSGNRKVMGAYIGWDGYMARMRALTGLGQFYSI